MASLAPSSALAGSAGVTLTVNGAGFAAGSVVRWNGAPRTTSVASPTRLTVTIPSTVTGATEASLQLLYWNGTAWAPVIGSGGALPVKNTTDNLDGTISGGRVTVTLEATSTPTIMNLAERRRQNFGALFARVVRRCGSGVGFAALPTVSARTIASTTATRWPSAVANPDREHQV